MTKFVFNETEKEVLQNLVPAPDSHKGQNGKVLVIGGSELFHVASKWSLDVLTKLVDMVFYCSTGENNELVSTQMQKEAKSEFWGGIVIEREKIEEYVEEAEAILIGPGMTRSEETKELTDRLLARYQDKKWIIDAGALQMVNPSLLPEGAILTPHERELEMLRQNGWQENQNVIILLKGEVDKVLKQGELLEEIKGGNSGMTKGGTGDCLAGLVAGIYAHNESAVWSASVASKICKEAGEKLWEEVGPFFDASDLATEIPKTLWRRIELEKREK